MKTKEPKKPVHYIKHGRVGFRYVVGISLIAIETDPDNNWPEMPDYYRVCLTVPTPAEMQSEAGRPYWTPNANDERIILQAIKVRINEQRKTHGAQVRPSGLMGSNPNQSRQMLPFEDDVVSDEGKTAV